MKGKTTRHPHPKQNRMVHSSIYYNVSKFITVYYCAYVFSYFSHIFLVPTLFHCVKVAVTVCYSLQRIYEKKSGNRTRWIFFARNRPLLQEMQGC